MVNSREKGRKAEQEVARLIAAHTGVSMQRNLRQTRDKGYSDLVVADGAPDNALTRYIAGTSFEVKYYGKYTLTDVRAWWRQTVDAADLEGKRACLWYRGAREPWRVVLPLSPVAVIELEQTMTLFAPGWEALVKGVVDPGGVGQ